MHSGSIWINGQNDSRRDSPDGANDNRPYMKNVETRLIVPRIRKRALASTLTQERDGGGGDAYKLYASHRARARVVWVWYSAHVRTCVRDAYVYMRIVSRRDVRNNHSAPSLHEGSRDTDQAYAP